jgi:hypothetical protein
MSFLRHRQIYQSDDYSRSRDDASSGLVPSFIVLMSLRPAIPWRVGLHQSPPPLHQPVTNFQQPDETVNHHLLRAGDFSTGTLGNFQPELTTPAPVALNTQRGLARRSRPGERQHQRRLRNMPAHSAPFLSESLG